MVQRLKKVILQGRLGRKYGKTHYFAVNTPAEVIKALEANHRGFMDEVIQSDKDGLGYRLVVDGRITLKDEIHNPFADTIKIIPIVKGAKGGLFGAILGVALIAAAVFVPAFGTIVWTAGGFGVTTFGMGTTLFNLGASMLLGGIAGMLSPQPKAPSPAKPEQNQPTYAFNGIVNTVSQGMCVPVGYGRLIVGSAVVSSGITAEDLNASGLSGTTSTTSTKLQSRAIAKFIDVISEGEIEGLATGDEKSIYFDGTPVKAADNSFNFEGYSYAEKKGTNSQSYVAGFEETENQHAVNVKVTQSTPVIRTITDSTKTAAKVTISFPSLYKVNSSGGVTGTTVQIKVDIQANGGGYNTIIDDTIIGKSTAKYEKTYLIQLTGSAPWDIKVRRITADSAVTTLINDVYFETYTEVVYQKLKYPNTAYIACSIDSKQFSNLPVRGYDMKLKKIQIPSNATVRSDGSLTYSGSWDGTFQTAWSANPAWCFYDMVTNSRYGLGNFITAAQVDKWTLYTIGQYCDTLVSNGFGGTEPRFTCNLYLQERNDAATVLQNMASIFRGMIYWSGGQIVATQDSPADAVALYSNANVQDGLFTYQGSSLKQRHSVVNVSWNDPSDLYKLKPERVENTEAIAKMGLVETSVVAVGCSSRGQAHRVGKWLLYSENYDTETVTFKTGLDGFNLRPSQIIKIQDKDRAGVRFGGRVSSATTTAITVDQAFTPSIGVTYTLYTMLPDGTMESKTVSSVSGNVINLSSALSTAPQANAIWIVSSNGISAQTFRVIGCVDGGDGTVEVTALKYNDSKYNYIESDLALATTTISILNDPPAVPTNLSLDEAIYETTTEAKVQVDLSWDSVPNAATYNLTYSVDDSNVTVITGLRNSSYQILDAESGSWTVTVQGVNSLGKVGQKASLTQTVTGLSAPPIDVQNLSLAAVSDNVANLSWDRATDIDVLVGGFVRLRWTPLTSGVDWSSAVDVSPALTGNTTSFAVPLVNGTYLAKFIDSVGNYSVNATTVKTTVATVVNMNTVTTITESTGFAGSKTQVVASGGILKLDSSGGNIYPTGTYNFQNTTDLGAVYTSRVTASITAAGTDTASTIDSRTDLIDDWASFDGGLIDDVNGTLYIRTTTDNPSGSPTWSTWMPFVVGQYTARAFQFKLVLTSATVTHNIEVSALSVTIDMPDRVQGNGNITSGASAYSVTFPIAYYSTPAIGITMNNAATGDYYAVTSQSATGFTVTFKNSAGTTISRNFDWLARGY